MIVVVCLRDGVFCVRRIHLRNRLLFWRSHFFLKKIFFLQLEGMFVVDVGTLRFFRSVALREDMCKTVATHPKHRVRALDSIAISNTAYPRWTP